MADEDSSVVSETPSGEAQAPVRTTKSRAARGTKRPETKERVAQPDKPKLKRHTEQEKRAKIKQIEDDIADGKDTLKSAVKRAGISDETYYQWKRAAKPAAAQENQSSSASFTEGDEITELLALEEENRQLRKTLAEKLRSENAALKKKLGLR